jgi:hypothetical protein
MKTTHQQRTVTIYDYPVNDLFNVLTQPQSPKTMKKEMSKGISPDYSFTKDNHFEIIEKLESYRIANRIDRTKFSNKAGYGKSTYTNLANNTQRFSEKSYMSFINTYPITSKNKESELTAQKCIDFLKATGEYKISKAETTTNWIEL